MGVQYLAKPIRDQSPTIKLRGEVRDLEIAPTDALANNRESSDRSYTKRAHISEAVKLGSSAAESSAQPTNGLDRRTHSHNRQCPDAPAHPDLINYSNPSRSGDRSNTYLGL
jgi:hypothetical protein